MVSSSCLDLRRGDPETCSTFADNTATRLNSSLALRVGPEPATTLGLVPIFGAATDGSVAQGRRSFGRRAPGDGGEPGDRGAESLVCMLLALDASEWNMSK